MIVSRSLRRHLFRVVAAAVLAVALLVSLRPSAEAANYTNWVAQVPSGNPTSAQSVRVWINSDTVSGETIRVEYEINGSSYHLVDGHYDNVTYPGATWYADIPTQPNGTAVRYQLITYNQSNSPYRWSGFNWSYTVDDGDIQWNGLRHDTFSNLYRDPFGAVPAGTNVILRLSTTLNDVDSVALRVYTYDPATGNTTGPVDYPTTYQLWNINGTPTAMWTHILTTPATPSILYYHFVITDGLDVDYYSDDHGGPHDNLNQGGPGAASDNQGAEGFQLTVYDPAFQTPDWLKDAVVYQIFPDRFRNGDQSNDYCRSGGTTGCPLFYGDQDILLREPWNTAIGDPRVPGPYFNEYGTQFYGGDLQGLIDKLDYLQDAGFDTIYTTPIFDGSSNHRYDTDDYMAIDPALGTLADFNELISELNVRGMHLIVDGVFNHTSSDSVYFDRYQRYPGNAGACESLGSDYRDWFEFQNTDVPCGDGDYTGWFGYSSLAVLQDGEDEVRDFIYRDTNSVMETWYDRGVHGWRFDVADEISHNWWRDFRPYAKADAANGPLVGEVWPDASAFLLGDQLDSVMNYRFRKNVLGFVRQNDFTDNDNNGNNEIISLTPSQFDRAMQSIREDYPPEATAAMLNLLDSHDTNRLRYLVDILGESDAQTLQRQKLAAVFQYTYMGAPMVYYGDEVALDSPSLANHVSNGPEDDPYNRAPYPWADEAGDDDIYGPADADMLAFYSRLAEIRQQYPVLVDGEFYTWYTGDTTNWTSADDTTYAFRRYKYPDQPVTVALNPGNSANTVDSLWVEYNRVEDLLTGTVYQTSGGYLTLNLPPRSAVILARVQATVTVNKVANGDTTGLSDWQFSVNGNPYTVPAAGGEFFTNVITGTTTVAETGVGGWTAAVSCDNGVNGTDVAIFNLTHGQDVVCTFTNTQDAPPSGDLTITKTVVGATPGADWAFTGDLGPFNLPASGGGATYSDQATGSYTINETYVPGWATTTSCTPGSETGGRSVTLTLDDGETAQCTFTNTLCQPGYYDDGTACVPTDPGYYTNVPGAVAQIACEPGYYQPNSAQDACLAADAGYYVDTTAATGQTACPLGTTSPPASDSIDDCVATTADLTIVKATDPAGGTGFPFTLDPGAVTFADKWGVNGVGQGDFNGPFGIAVDAAGNVYVADTFAYRVQKFDADGNFILMWGRDVQVGGVTGFEICLAAESCKAGTNGSGNGEFNLPHGVAVDGNGNVYVSDSFNDRIQKFDTDGNYVGQWGGSGDNGGQFDNPTGVAVDGAGNVYVADSFNNRIQKFGPAGNFLFTWGYDVLDDGTSSADFEICTASQDCWSGRAGNGDGQFNNPYGVAVYGSNVYVADTFNHRVEVFDTNGNYQDKWGGEGSGNGQFDRPYGLAADAAGNIYVADSNNAREQKFDGDGDTLGQWGVSGTGDGQFFYNTGVTVSGAGVYVTDYNAHRVQRFSQTGATLDDGQSHTFEDLAAGTYLVSELVPANWTLDDITCDGGSPAESGNAVSVTLAAGDNVTCAFSNSYDAPDTTPPDTTITGNPPNPSNSNSASFTFSGDDGGGSGVASFQCQIDGGGFTACTSPQSYSGLADGSHTFQVRAIDTAGNTDPTPAGYTWTIDTTPPDTTITTTPPNPSNIGSATFTFTGNDPGGPGVASFQCQIDGGGFTACTSPQTYTGLSDGSHTFQVRAIDTAGNTDPTPASYTWTIDTAPPDTTPPTVTINQASGQADPTGSSPINFTVEFSEAVTGFATGDVTLSGTAGATTAVVSGSGATYNVAVSGMTGSGTVVATIGAGVADDAAGNDNTASTSTDNTVNYNAPDTTPPDTTIITNPPNPSNSSSAAFNFSGSDGGSGVASFACQIDGGGFTPCTSPQTYSGLSDGSHTFQVRAIDAAGNTDPTPASYTWVVDTAAPTVTINQASGQADPTSASPINFTVVFSEAVTGFATGDVTLSGTAGATTAVVSGSGTTYNVAVSGMTGDGTVVATIAAAVADDAAGNDNTASTSTDNTVTYNAPDTTAPTVTINQASGQADPTSSSPINFTVVFSEPVSGFATGDVTLSGTAGATTAVVSGSGTTYNVAVSGMTGSGTVVATVAAAVAQDAAGNDNTASTSTDNTVTYNAPDTTAPTVTINQASGQADPTSSSPINFTVVFSEPVTGFATGDVTLSGTAGATTAVVSGSGATYNVAVSGMTGSGTVIATVAANRAEDAAGNDNAASTSTDNTVTYNAPAPAGAIYVTAAGGSVPGAGAYQKNDILKWNGSAWSVWFDGASAGMLATADIIAFDVDDDSDGSAWVVIRQAQKLPGVGKMEPQQIAYYNGSTWTRFFDGRDVGLLTTGERINGLEVLPGSVSPIGGGCQYYLLISTIAGGGVPVGSTNVNFTGEDVLGFCMTQSGANTAGTWHIRFEGQSEGLQKNNNYGVSASDDATTLYFTAKSNFTGDGGLVKPSELFSWSGGTFSGPLWKAKDHGLNQVVDGIDVVGSIP